MPQQFRDELILLYARNRIADIGNVAAFQQLRDLFAQNVSFQAERDRIERAKAWVEEALDKALTQQETARNAVKLLVQTRADCKLRDLCHELIVAGYVPNWTATQQQYFEAAWKTVKLEYDYFLSFTSRYPAGVAGDNPINTAYKQFIISELTYDVFNKTNRKSTNLLALAVHRLLSQPLIKGFYYPHKQYDNSQTEQKLEEACDSCLVFVQLVQTIMFDPPQGPINYCFFEWSRVKAKFLGPDSDKRILYVVAAPDRNVFMGILPDIRYNRWHGDVGQKDPPYLPEVQFRNNVIVKEIKKTFQNVVVPQIRAAWFRLIDSAPQ